MTSPLSSGSVFGQYRIEGVLGQGGMGIVYRANDTKLNRPVAIKLLSPDIANGEARRRFQREAQMASSLNHPHIVTVHDAGEWDGQQYIVTEFVDGGTLSSWAAAEPRNWRQCVNLLTGVVEALAAAHEARILHRDIKPGNILVLQNGYAKLADFGLAKMEEPPSASDDTVTRTGVVLGTTAYMSPEQAMGRKCDARSDIFSLGVVLYELLSGRRPFSGASSPEILNQIIHQDPAPLAPAIPAALRSIVEKAMEKSPEDRYQSAREVAVDLRRVARRADSAAEPSITAPAVPLSRSNRLRSIVAAVLVMGILVAGLAYRNRSANNDPSLQLQISPPSGGYFSVGALATLGGIALSPDGNTLAFVASVDGIEGLWLQPLNGTAHKVEGPFGPQHPFWSPDNKSIAYFATGGLYRVDASGGSPVFVASADANLPCHGAWTEDNQILYGCGGTGIFAIPVSSGGEAKSILGNNLLVTQALPGGAFLYWKGTEPQGIYAASLSQLDKGKLLVQSQGLGMYASGHLLWLNGTSLLAQPFDPAKLMLSGAPKTILNPVASGGAEPSLTVSLSGRIVYDAEGNDDQLTWYARTGQPQGPTGSTGSFQGFRIFDSGRRIMVMALAKKDQGLWLIDERGRSNHLISGKVTVNPTPSPDGRSIVFSYPSPNGWLLQRADITGDRVISLDVPNRKDFQFATDWSGDILLFTISSAKSGNDIWWLRMSPDGTPAPGAKPQSFLETTAIETFARFAPNHDQHWLAYSSNESGRFEIYIQSFPTKGEKLTVSDQGGGTPFWGPGGNELFYVSLDNKVMKVEVTYGTKSVSTTKPTELFALPVNNRRTSGATVETSDGQRFLILSPVAPANRPLKIITNWPALLRQ